MRKDLGGVTFLELPSEDLAGDLDVSLVVYAVDNMRYFEDAVFRRLRRCIDRGVAMIKVSEERPRRVEDVVLIRGSSVYVFNIAFVKNHPQLLRNALTKGRPPMLQAPHSYRSAVEHVAKRILEFYRLFG